MKDTLELQPLVTVIINNYNYERFVGQAIESALQQTYSNVEVIVVDDGSSDHSFEVIQRYNGQVIVIRKENGGQAAALNAGFAACHGEVVIFLDADDLLLPTAVKHVIEVFLSRPETVRVQYRMEVIDEYGHFTGIVKPEMHIPVPSGDVRKQALTFPFDIPWLPTSGNAFSVKALRQIMPIPLDRYGSVGADWYLVHLTHLLGQVFFLDSLEACYRVHSANHYERGSATLDFQHIRQTIRYCQVTSDYLQRYAEKLGLIDRPVEILAVSYIANRMVSLRLEPENHPILTDTPWGLLKLGARSTLRRFDISIELKLIFLSWFFMMAIIPKAWGKPLARLFLFPQERGKVNQLLGKMHIKRVSHQSVLQPTARQE